ncbi:MAG TPA: hypothetical protein VNB29_07150 [Chthoniobacterales bacterium]|nr:hypothetical protein [Chthoniobacterales bacterium]
MTWRILFISLSAALLAPAIQAAPVRYDVEATVATVPKLGREPFGSKFFFTTGGQVIYRVLPADRSDTDPATRFEYWSPGDTLDLLPAAGYESLDIVALDPQGTAVGRSVTENSSNPNPHAEAALLWTPAGGSTVPAGFDLGSSGFKAMSPTGLAAGFTNSGTYRTVSWDSANPIPGGVDIVPPAGYGNCEVRGVSASGETLLYVSNPGQQNVAVWNGTSSTVIGPAPNSDETFYPSNSAINSAGDVAMAFFSATGYRIIFIPAANRANYQIFSFNGTGSSVYHLQISDAGLASCETSVNGANVVSIVSSTYAQQLNFDGYSAFLNAAGEFVFGNQGAFYYWDARAWTGSPSLVPLALPSSPTAPTLVGFNDDSRLLTLSDDASQTTRTLSILAPEQSSPTPTPGPPTPTPDPIPTPAPTPSAEVTVQPARKTVRFTAGDPIQSTPLVKIHVTGVPASSVRYVLSGKLPRGLRFRASDGSVRGRPTQAQRANVRIAATYPSAGGLKQSAFVKVKIQVGGTTSPPIQ